MEFFTAHCGHGFGNPGQSFPDDLLPSFAGYSFRSGLSV